MTRGGVYAAATGSGYGSKPRPVIVMQSPSFDDLGSRLVVPMTSEVEETIPFRPVIMPDRVNGLRRPSAAMVDKILAVREEKFGERFGQLSEADLLRIEGMALVLLGLIR